MCKRLKKDTNWAKEEMKKFNVILKKYQL
jgi:hypothetical protein